jgi:hypothetical protein
MPITRLLSERNFTSEQRDALEIAFGTTVHKLGLVDRNDPICEIVARAIVRIADRGVTDPAAICDVAVKELGSPTE